MAYQSLECTSDTQLHTLRHSLEKGSSISSQHAQQLGNGCTFQEKEIEQGTDLLHHVYN